MYSFILSLLRVVSHSLSTGASPRRWFNNGFRQDAFTYSPTDRISVKSETGFRAETIDFITSVSFHHGFNCVVFGSSFST